jgi:RNA polymerase-binding transcription factor DksA
MVMKPDKLDHFRRKLLAERDAIDRRIGAAQAEARHALDPAEAIDDRGPRSEIADNSLGLATLLTRQRREIDDALLRIELDEYGVCEDCGSAIEPERLEAMPSSRLCESDARRADRRHPPKL